MRPGLFSHLVWDSSSMSRAKPFNSLPFSKANEQAPFLIQSFGGNMRHIIGSLALTALLLSVSANAFAQGGNGTLTGTINDASSALIPGVTVTALNTATGVLATTVSNESGAYNISSLLPGVYRLTATLPGFRTQTYSNVELGTNETKRFNFTLEVAGVATMVASSSSISRWVSASIFTVGLRTKAVRITPRRTSSCLCT